MTDGQVTAGHEWHCFCPLIWSNSMAHPLTEPFIILSCSRFTPFMVPESSSPSSKMPITDHIFSPFTPSNIISFRIRFNFLSPTPRSPEFSLSFRFSDRNAMGPCMSYCFSNSCLMNFRGFSLQRCN